MTLSWKDRKIKNLANLDLIRKFLLRKLLGHDEYDEGVKLLDEATTTGSGESFEVRGCKNFSFQVNADTGTKTDIEYSNDGITFFKLVTGILSGMAVVQNTPCRYIRAYITDLPSGSVTVIMVIAD